MAEQLRLIAKVMVPGIPVPWSAPRTFLGGQPGGKRHHVHEKAKRLIAWQDAVRFNMGPVDEPYTGPVHVAMTFSRETVARQLWGTPWWALSPGRLNADLTNLYKATEDAICTRRQYKGKGADRVLVALYKGLIENDAQVCHTMLRKEFGPADGVLIGVYAIEESP